VGTYQVNLTENVQQSKPSSFFFLDWNRFNEFKKFFQSDFGSDI